MQAQVPAAAPVLAVAPDLELAQAPVVARAQEVVQELAVVLDLELELLHLEPQVVPSVLLLLLVRLPQLLALAVGLDQAQVLVLVLVAAADQVLAQAQTLEAVLVQLLVALLALVLPQEVCPPALPLTEPSTHLSAPSIPRPAHSRALLTELQSPSRLSSLPLWAHWHGCCNWRWIRLCKLDRIEELCVRVVLSSRSSSTSGPLVGVIR